MDVEVQGEVQPVCAFSAEQQCGISMAVGVCPVVMHWWL
jgi:hypothetical protein